MHKYFLFLIFIFFSLQNIQAIPKTEKVRLVHDGYERSYEFYVPANFSPAQTYPIVILLHGGGGKAKGIIRVTRARFNTLADSDDFIVIYPNGVGKSWNDGARDTFGVARNNNINDVGFIEKVIEDMGTRVNIDYENIFVCGISNGGFMAQRLAFELSEKIKGIGVVAANLSIVQSQKDYPQHPVSVIFINGTDDPIVPYQGGPVTVLRQNRGEILSVAETIGVWKQINHCSHITEKVNLPDINKKDGCTAEKTVYENPANPNQKVVEIKIQGGGHTWPGTRQNIPKGLVGNTNRDFNACDEIWSFFKSLIN